MGIIASIPLIEGLGTVLPLSSTTLSTSYAFDPGETNASSISTTVFDRSTTKPTPVVTVPEAQTERVWPTHVTDVIMALGPTSPDSTDTFATYLSTKTVTITIGSTHLVTITTTVVANNCRATTTTASSTVQSAAHTSRTLGTLKHSSTFSSIISGISDKHRSGHLPMSKKPSVATVRTANPTRAASISHLDRERHAPRRPAVTYGELDYTLSSSGASVTTRYLARVTGTRKRSTISGPTDLRSTTALMKIDHVTTTTVYKSVTTNHTSTTTTTTLPISCITNQTSSSSKTASTSCTSATPNPKPPTNDTCAEDGLLEYSNNSQPPDTLEACAAACLADTSCFSFTFIPSKSTCYTSLYPLADSAFAGMQQYHIYNYDRDCYSCSS